MPAGSTVLLVGSIAPRLGFPGNSVYAASKAAVRSLARTLSSDLLDRGIRVNVVSPGPIDTPLFEHSGRTPEQAAQARQAIVARTPAGRFGTPEDVARAALFLCSPESSYVYGEELVVDGGWVNAFRWEGS